MDRMLDLKSFRSEVHTILFLKRFVWTNSSMSDMKRWYKTEESIWLSKLSACIERRHTLSALKVSVWMHACYDSQSAITTVRSWDRFHCVCPLKRVMWVYSGENLLWRHLLSLCSLSEKSSGFASDTLVGCTGLWTSPRLWLLYDVSDVVRLWISPRLWLLYDVFRRSTIAIYWNFPNTNIWFPIILWILLNRYCDRYWTFLKFSEFKRVL